MATPSLARPVEAPPTYVRLPPGASSYTIELSADVVQRLTGEIVAAGKLGVETGGLLLGSWEPAPVLMVRVRDFELIPPQSEDGPAYLLSPRQQEEFAAARQRAADKRLTPIGFFRSHLRSGPLALSLADKALLSRQFRSDPFLAILIEAREPYKASIFMSVDGQIALYSSVAAFPPPNELAVIPARQTPLEVEEPPEEKQRRRVSPVMLALCSMLLFAIGVVLWPAWEATFGGPWASASSTDMALVIQPRGHHLDVTWNRRMPEISRAEGATLTIVDGSRRSELQLGKDDLKFGTIAYVYKGGRVEANLALKMQDSTSLVQSAVWQK